MNYEYVECHCTTIEHTMRFTLDNDETFPMICVDIQLNKQHGFFGRLWLAVKYIFGYKCKYGHWDDFILAGNEALKLRDLCDRHLKQWEKINGFKNPIS